MRRICRVTKVEEKTGYSRSTIYRLEQMGEFPLRRKLSQEGRAVGWDEDEVDQWCASRPQVASTSSFPQIGSGKSGPGRGHKKPAQA